MIIGSDRKTVRNNYPAVKDHKIFTAFWRHLSRAWYENIFQMSKCDWGQHTRRQHGSHSVRNRRASNTRERPLEKFWISYFNEVAGPGRVSRVPRGSDPCINCLRIELGERVCANGKIWIWIFLIMVLICSNSKSFRIEEGEPLSEIRLKGFDILCWKIVPRRPFHCGGWTFGQFYNPPSLRK